MKKIIILNTFLACLFFINTKANAQIINGSYRLFAKNTVSNPKYIQIQDPTNASWGTNYIGNYQQHDESFGEDQVWNIEKVEKDYYIIKSYLTGKCIEAHTTGVGLLTTTYSSKNTQMWQIKVDTDGSYWIINKSNGLVISVQGGDGAQDSGFIFVQEGLYTDSNIRSSQKFIITPFDVSVKKPGATGTGLLATYNNGLKQQGTVSMSRTDAQVNFNPFTVTNTPNGIDPNTNFSVKWEGQIESPVNGRVTFYAKVDDGVKIWVNNKLVLDQASSTTTDDASFYVNLIKGEKNNIKIEYFNTAGSGNLILSWKYNGQVKQIIPKTFLYPSVSQDDVQIVTANPNQLLVIAKDYPNQTKLRWTPANPTAWMKGVVRGYKVERFTTKIGGVAQSQPYTKREWTVLAERKESPLWNNFKQQNLTKTAIEGFDLEESYLAGINQALWEPNKMSLAQRYFTASVITNLSYEAAKVAGVGLTDATALDTEEYIYKVSFIDETTAIDPGEVIVRFETGKAIALPNPIIKTVTKLNRADKTPKCTGVDCDSLLLQVSFGTKITKQFYGSYWVERNDDNTTYKRLNTTPLITLTKVDSLLQSDTIAYLRAGNYKFKIVGRTYFGDDYTSPETTFTYAPPLEYSPVILESNFIGIKRDNASVKWEFPKSNDLLVSDKIKIKALLSKYQIEISGNPTENFTLLMDNIPISLDNTILKKTPIQDLVIADTSVYVRVVAVGLDGKKTYSGSVMLMPSDTTAPAKPQFIPPAVFDATKKIVTLNWRANTERDFSKYIVFRKNFTGDKYWNKIGRKDTSLTAYRDTLKIDVNSDKLWYGLIAVDKRGNYSPMDSIFITRPDTTAPVNPIFLNYEPNRTLDSVKINWKLGDIEDIGTYTLSKNSLPGCPLEGWVSVIPGILKSTPLNSDENVIDPFVRGGSTYCYLLKVEDKASPSNKSISKPLIVQLLKETTRTDITNFTANFVFDEKKTDLLWTYTSTDPDLISFEIARAEDKEPYSSWQVFNKSNLSASDFGVFFNTVYKYAVRGLFKDGTSTSWKEYVLTTPIGCKSGKYEVIRNQKFTIFNVPIDKACNQIILQPGFDSERQSYEATIEKN